MDDALGPLTFLSYRKTFLRLNTPFLNLPLAANTAVVAGKNRIFRCGTGLAIGSAEYWMLHTQASGSDLVGLDDSPSWERSALDHLLGPADEDLRPVVADLILDVKNAGLAAKLNPAFSEILR